MALKKSQIYTSLWQSCDELRGGMDASQYKDYILTLLFLKYVSDKYSGDRGLLRIPSGASFADIAKLKGNKEIGERINKIIAALAEANDLQGVIDQADYADESKLGSGKEMQDRLSKLVAIFENLDFRGNRAEGDDLLGDAYEYLMRHFATESGKAKGQFYTPAEVSRIMAQVIGIGPDTRNDQTIYDPTCGSGSLLLKGADASPRGITIYGQEMEVATWSLARMNMILHDQPTADIRRGNTLANPQLRDTNGALQRFDFAVANPPFSTKAWSSGIDPEHDEFGRFEYGVPPAKNGDYAFLLHLITSLKSRGKGAIILPHGVLFRGNREAEIRRELVRRGLIKGIIGLPANLFYGTGIPACIIVIDKEHAQGRTGIFMVDASRGFIKNGNKNRLRSQDIHRMVDVFNRGLEIERYSRMVPLSEIANEANDYNLNIPRYIDSSEPEDLHDLDAHLNGGIPECDVDALSAYWSIFPSLRDRLFVPADRPGYLQARVEPREVKRTILETDEFAGFRDRAARVLTEWFGDHRTALSGISGETVPKELIHALSEDLLARFVSFPLVDRYDVYQRLMDFWSVVMQDDVYLLVADGWLTAAKPRLIVSDSLRKIQESPDLVFGSGKKARKYKLDLIPPGVLSRVFFKAEREQIDALSEAAEAAARELEELTEEHAGDEGLLADATNDKGKVTKAAVKERLKALAAEDDSDEEREVLERCLDLMDRESDAAKAVKEAQASLDVAVLEKYGDLSLQEIKHLVIDEKWSTSLREALDAEVDRLTQTLADRIKELETRYAEPLPALEREVEELGSRVADHLKTMGLAW
jgi:type I restriction enzyme M protein